MVRAPCMGACDRAPVAAVGHLQTFQATADKIAADVKANKHPHAWHPGADFAAYQKAGGYALLKDCLAGKRTRDDLIKIVSDAACAASAAPDFRPGANGNWCAPSRRRACSRSMPTRASPAPSRTAFISSATRTASSKAC